MARRRYESACSGHRSTRGRHRACTVRRRGSDPGRSRRPGDAAPCSDRRRSAPMSPHRPALQRCRFGRGAQMPLAQNQIEPSAVVELFLVGVLQQHPPEGLGGLLYLCSWRRVSRSHTGPRPPIRRPAGRSGSQRPRNMRARSAAESPVAGWTALMLWGTTRCALGMRLNRDANAALP